jgi:hypothetical protein
MAEWLVKLQGHEFDLQELNRQFTSLERSADVGGDMVTKGWTTKAEAGRFTQTTNSVGASGDEARHAAEHTPPPKPMSLKDAEQFIKALLADLIRSKK